ncbi:uncharacterized protein LOC113297591 [Papaver somniferum]|uniref:uncharacterized protein LOC113297591 n=1 Tax=Papaver somniferum TaxID=3469 RepID=UPI000E703D78|nr:uncharacterized protein LOC113297591 [Papaver somniferum]
MEVRVLLVCLAVGFLGIVSAALGFAAEAKRIKVSEVQFSAPGMCTYPRSPALALGLTASVALVLAQVTINVSAGCVCCKTNVHPSNSNWTLALVCFVFSWFTFIIAFLLFLTGLHLMTSMVERACTLAATAMWLSLGFSQEVQFCPFLVLALEFFIISQYTQQKMEHNGGLLDVLIKEV